MDYPPHTECVMSYDLTSTRQDVLEDLWFQLMKQADQINDQQNEVEMEC